MNQIAKYSLIGLGALVALVAIGAAVFLASFDANRYKSEIAAQVKAATGRDLSIGGDLDVEFFPWLAITADDLTLSNRAGFGDAPFMRLASATARVKLVPLLSRRIEVGTVRIEGLALALTRKADGSDNWSDMTSDEPAAAETAASAPLDLSVEGVSIVDASLTLDDAQAARKLVVQDLDLETGPLAKGEPLAFNGDVRLSSDAPQVVAKLGMSGRMLPGFDVLEDLALTIDAEGSVLPAPLKAGRLGIAKLTLGEPLTVEGFVFEAWGIKLGGELTLKGEELKGRFASESFEPRVLMKTLGMTVPVTADKKALGSAKFSFDLAQRGDMLRLDTFKLTLDQSTLSGRLAVDSIERSALRFDLALDAMDMDRYLPPATAAGAPEDGGLDAIALPTESIRGLDLHGKLRAAKLSVAKADLTDLRLELTARDGALVLDSLTAKLYGGNVEAHARLDGKPKTPTVALDVELASFKVGDFMQDVIGKVHATGVAELTLDLAGHGATLGDVKRDLDGKVRFDLQQGTLEGFNVWKQARIAYAAYKQRATTAASDPDRTEFEKLAGGADLKDGVATLVGVTAAIPFAAVTAKGIVDLKASTLKVEAQAKITGAPVFGPKEDYSDLKGATLPVKVSGPFAKPSVSVDVLKAAVSKLKPEQLLKDDKLKKKLKSIFG
jgi:AsmA protein